MLMTRPKPRHLGQAPTGWLKLKRAGEGSRYSMSHCAQWRRLEKERGLDTPDGGRTSQMVSLPLPKWYACSQASVNRARLFVVSLRRSWTTVRDGAGEACCGLRVACSVLRAPCC